MRVGDSYDTIQTMSKLLVVGFDGATFDLINPLVQNGRLPTLAHLMQHGAFGTLHSTVPPITPTAWTTVFTGKNPGKHGIFDFQEIDPKTYARQPVFTDRHLEKTVWDLLGEAGLRSIITDVPYTYPPRPLNGLMLTGYGTPRTAQTVFTHPLAWEAVLPTNLHDQIRVAQPTQLFDRSRAFLNEWAEIMNGRSRLLHHLLTKQEWNFFFHVFSITDNLAHVFWTYLEPSHPNYQRPEAPEYREALLQAYVQCDELLGQMLEWAGSDCNVIVMSDHGFGSVYPRQYLFQRLVDGGFMQYSSAGGGIGQLKGAAMRQAIRLYNGLPFLREFVKNLRPNSQNALKNSLKSAGMMPSNDAIDFHTSKVFPSDFGLQLWLNHQMRFANGVLSEGETAVTQTNLITHLLADRDKATGQPIIKQVYKGSEQYDGTHAWLGPDLIIKQTNFYRPDAPSHPSNPRLEGSHTHDGVFFACGPAIRQAELQGEMHLRDLAPTMLYLLNQPVPPDMDGKLLDEAIRPDFLQTHPVQHGDQPAQYTTQRAASQLTDAEEEELKQQLRQLGYME